MSKQDDIARLRLAAEERLREAHEASAGPSGSADLPRLVHELQVHQIELEMQKEELHRAHEELDAERARYFDLYNLAPVGYCTLDAQGLIQQANLTVAGLLGIGRSQLVNRPLAGFVVKEDVQLYHRHYAQVIKSGAGSVCELRLVRQDGTSFWTHLAAGVGQDSGGAVVLRVVLSDIGERKKAEEALREQNEFFHLVAENIIDFIAVLNREGQRLYNNPAYVQFFGATGNLLGTDSFADIHPEDRERVERVFRETVQSGKGRQIDYRLVIADGSIREMESRGSVSKDSEGRVVRVVVISHDITERKQFEGQVRQLAFHDTLTRLPNRRLLDDRLRQSMAASVRSGCHGAVMFLDMDNFKQLNDRHGHAAGDSLLIEAADRLRSCVREMDTVARFGGDEFVVMISELAVDKTESIAQASIIAEKIRTALLEPYLVSVKYAGSAEIKVEHHCTASIGVVLFINHDASQRDVLKWADSAMYLAKAAGRNSIRFYDPHA